MNTKKNKGKSKQNKAPNPNPPQKIEESGKVTENIEDVSVGEIDSAQKSDIRVPEIISDVIIPAVEVKEKEDDSPKKPKRNRGKKKKHEKDEDEDQDDKPTESIDIIEIVEVKPQETLTEENVPPSARKKKNKNKKAVDPEPKSTEKVETIVSETEQKKTQETELSVKEDIAPQNVTDQEAKQPKKKNKKKKRNDSERSEKADEVSCTAAFQKLLKDDKTEIKTADDQPIEDIKTLAKFEIENVPKGEEQELNKDSLKPESEKPEQNKNTAQDVPATSMNEPGGKNKKKNKKDKKELPKDKETKDFDTPDIESDFDMPEIVPITDLIPSSEELTKSVRVQEKMKEEKITEDKNESKAPEEIKPKAKIAKPVERKRKGKEDSQAQDLPEVSTPEDKALPISELPKGEAVTSKVEEIKTEVPGKPVDFIASKENKQDVSSKIEKPTENIPEIKATELIDVPEIDKNKKRKKSPKPGKAQQKSETSDQAEIKTEIHMEKEIQPAVTTTEISVTQPIVEVKSQDAIITQAFEELIRIPESDKSKKRKKSPKPSKLDQKPKNVPETSAEPVIAIQEEIKPGIQMGPKIEEELKPLSATEGIESPKESASEKPTASVVEKSNIELLSEKEDTTPDDAKILDTKSKKKRKKSPKLPFGPETAAETKDTVTASGVMSEKQEKLEKDSNIQSEEISQSKSDVLYDMPLVEDIEIRSLKADESEGSTCGFTPDIIQHPRATSQDLIDDNNNMFIQEITIEEVKLKIPTDMPDTPFIQGSGETPLKTPESIFTGFQISEMNIDAGKGEQEKTDIKSKMMEVNQDMEELRLSIERSLAELTAIEKSEGEVERKLEEKAAHIPNVPKSPEVKISMPSELIFKSQLENVETPTPKEKKIKEVVASAEDVVSKPAEASTFSTMSFEKESENKSVQIEMSEKSTSVADMSKPAEKKTDTITPPTVPARKDKSKSKERDIKNIPMKPSENIVKPDIATETPTTDCVADTPVPPAIPARKDNKNKSKNKKKGKQDVVQTVTQTESASTSAESKEPAVKEETTSKEEKKEQKSDAKQDKGKQHSAIQADDKTPSDQEGNSSNPSQFEPIENFEDAMTSSADDINKTFEMIANEATSSQFVEASHVNPEIKIVAPIEDTKPDKKDEKVNPVSPPKNLLGHPDIPVPSNRTDYKKEKNKAPNTIVAKVKIKDAVQIEGKKQTKDTQTDNIRKFMKTKSIDESFTSVTNENDEFVYKYSFRKVFLQSACHVCKKELKQTRVPCNFCNLIFYCNAKHKDEDWAKHQGFCFAVSTIVHLKDQKHIYADSKNITGQDYRLLRMQMIVSCEKVLKRKLTPFEQEALLYPRVCADAACREWRQSKLVDCDGCGQISYCSDQPEHFPKTHQRWCKSYSLYQKLVCYQQTQGRLEPKLPSKIMVEPHQLSEKMNEVLAAMYEEKIDMNDIQYAALTQIATAPLTAAYCLQTYAKLANHTNGTSKKTTCTIHIVGGELQFEADALNKWEVFFLHLRPDLQELRVVMVGRDLNPSNLPLELLGKVKLCESCRSNKRRVVFSFQDKTTYHDFWASDDFVSPDIVCAFNPSIKRSSMYNGKDPWPKTINCVLKLKTPFLITAYTMNELQKDLSRIKECSEVDHKVVIEQKFNSFASVRPDRNFISDDEMPLLFKNYCYMLITGAN
ncbi:hypothetical protein ABMA28_010019 [Loxostege sticticalis]|uniref:MYND-type domain-containing protein n=1 Tax=Loxostege sticticalis TaxID=481309 RepID=A0ABD0S9F3_LOXSC